MGPQGIQQHHTSYSGGFAPAHPAQNPWQPQHPHQQTYGPPKPKAPPMVPAPYHQPHLIGKPGTQLPITKIWNQLQATNAHAVAKTRYAVLTFSGSFNPV